MNQIRSDLFSGIKKIVIKVGTRLILDDQGSALHRPHLERLVDEIVALLEAGYQVVLVTSGAVGVGMGYMGLRLRPKQVAVKQACAAIGQIELMHSYFDCLRKKGRTAAQILLSGDDFRRGDRYTNAMATISTLLSKGIVPIINENDTISTAEIAVGDNDKLSADVAHFTEADLLIILSDEDGLYDKNPKLHPKAQRIATVAKVTQEILNLGGAPGSHASVGGMKAKLEAIRQATEGGTPTLLAHGHRAKLLEILQGAEVGTLFLPNPRKIGRRKRWLAFVSKAKGQIFLDAGAISALQNKGSSILSAGIVKVSGSFLKGDFIEICSTEGLVLGRGRASYNSEEIGLLKGARSSEIMKLLHRKGPDEVLHRDNLVLF